MKKLIFLFFISIGFASKAQMLNNFWTGSDSASNGTNGVLAAKFGFQLYTSFADTTAANAWAGGRLKGIPGCEIRIGNRKWIRSNDMQYWIIQTVGNAWLETGNSGTDADVNYIGTNDDNPIRYKINNAYAGFLGSSNLGLGTNSLPYNTGNSNTSIGNNSMANNISGLENTAIGLSALSNNTTGGGNNALGNAALSQVNTGSSNTGIGSGSGESITTGNNNTMLGSGTDVGSSNQTHSMAIGNNARVECDSCASYGSVDENIKHGFGTKTPTARLHTVGTVRHENLGTSSSDTTTNKPVGINSSGDLIPMTSWPSGGGVSTSPAGSNTQIQYNNSGAFGASTNLTYSSGTLGLNGAIAGTAQTKVMSVNETASTGPVNLVHFNVGQAAARATMLFSNNSSGNWVDNYMLLAQNGASYTGNDYFTNISGKTADAGFTLLVNGGSQGTGMLIGTNTSTPLYLGTNNSARLSITNSGNVGIGTTTPDASAVLDVQSTTQGVAIPRMTATQASAISSPIDALMIYVTSTNGTFTAVGFWGRENGVWIKL